MFGDDAPRTPFNQYRWFSETLQPHFLSLQQDVIDVSILRFEFVENGFQP